MCARVFAEADGARLSTEGTGAMSARRAPGERSPAPASAPAWASSCGPSSSSASLSAKIARNVSTSAGAPSPGSLAQGLLCQGSGGPLFLGDLTVEAAAATRQLEIYLMRYCYHWDGGCRNALLLGGIGDPGPGTPSLLGAPSPAPLA